MFVLLFGGFAECLRGARHCAGCTCVCVCVYTRVPGSVCGAGSITSVFRFLLLQPLAV